MSFSNIAIEVDIISLVITLFMGFLYDGAGRLQSTTFKYILYGLLCFSLADIGLHLSANSARIGVIFSGLKVVAWTTSCVFWFIYVFCKTHHSSYTIRKWFPLIFLPSLSVNIGAVVVTIDHLKSNTPMNNNFLWASLIASTILYVVAAAVVSLKQLQKTTNPFIRRECIYLSLIMFFPLLSIPLQSYYKDFPITAPVISLTFLHLYIVALKKRISVDALTGLNNIYKMAEHIENVYIKRGNDQRIFCIQICIENIKDIKKTSSEKAIEIIEKMAKYLQLKCKNQKVFLARSGYATFTLITERDHYSEIEALCERFSNSNDFMDFANSVGTTVNYSICWSELDSKITANPNDLIKEESKNYIKVAH